MIILGIHLIAIFIKPVKKFIINLYPLFHGVSPSLDNKKPAKPYDLQVVMLILIYDV